jgi:hypothetical protein
MAKEMTSRFDPVDPYDGKAKDLFPSRPAARGPPPPPPPAPPGSSIQDPGWHHVDVEKSKALKHDMSCAIFPLISRSFPWATSSVIN